MYLSVLGGYVRVRTVTYTYHSASAVMHVSL